MDITINPREMHDFAGIYGATIAAFSDGFCAKFSPNETIYIAAVSLFGAILDDERLLSFCQCLFGLLQRRVFIGLDGKEFPLPEYEERDAKDPLFFSALDAFFGFYGFYLYVQGKVSAPEQALRPLGFLLYEAYEGMEEGLYLKNESYRPAYDSAYGKIVANEETFMQWKAHLDFVKDYLAAKQA